MQFITPTIKLHTVREDQGTYLGNFYIEHQGNNYHLHGCTGTTIHTFTESICLYVLCINDALNTISLHCFMGSEPDSISTVFLHDAQEINGVLGKGWESIKPEIIVRKLIDHLN